MKKILFVGALILTMCFGMTVSAAGACDCEMDGKRPHDTSHNVEYVPNADGTTHEKICASCTMNGHSEGCNQVKLGSEAHDFTIVGTGTDRKQICYTCGYETAAVCDHANATYKEAGLTHDDEKNCYKICPDCKTVVSTKKHNFKYVEYKDEPIIHDEKHKKVCKDCGYSKDEKHDLDVTYTPYKTPKNPIGQLNKLTWPARDHKVVKNCKHCSYTFTDSVTYYGNDVAHTFKNNKCTKCGLKREVLKISGLKGKQSGKGTCATIKTKACWYWTGSKLFWQPAGSYKSYGYKAKLSWKKNKKAYGYVISLEKPKQGGFVNQTGTKTTNYWFSKKPSYTYASLSTKPLKQLTLYVAPVSKYGFIGKASKVTVKVK